MVTATRRRLFILVSSTLLAASASCSAPASSDGVSTTDSELRNDGKWTVFDPMAANIAGEVTTHEDCDDNKSSASLHVTGLMPNMMYMAHVHELPCNQQQGGDEYMNKADGGDNMENEMMLDFTTDKHGSGRARTSDSWVFRPASQRSVVVHAPMNMDGGMMDGAMMDGGMMEGAMMDGGMMDPAKIACLNVRFRCPSDP